MSASKAPPEKESVDSPAGTSRAILVMSFFGASMRVLLFLSAESSRTSITSLLSPKFFRNASAVPRWKLRSMKPMFSFGLPTGMKLTCLSLASAIFFAARRSSSFFKRKSE